MERQLMGNRGTSLNFIYLTSDNDLDIQKSLLQLIAITKIAKQARFSITLHCSDLISPKTWERLISQFKNEFEKLSNGDMLIVYDTVTSENSPYNSLFYLTTNPKTL